MSLEENKAILRKAIEAINKKDLSLLDDLVAPNYFDHIAKQGQELIKQFKVMLYKGFPDYHATIEDIIAEGEKVWVRVKITMTHTLEYRGIAPTGKKITETSVSINRIVDGKITEQWYVTDDVDFYKQLGAIDYKGFPDEDS